MKKHLFTIILSLLSLVSFATKEQEFWTWVKSNKTNIESILESHQFVSQLNAKIQAYNELLTFEIGKTKNNKINFIISCGGIRDGIPVVKKLVKASRQIENWNIIAFKQAKEELYTIEENGISVKPSQIKVKYKVVGNTANLDLYIKDYDGYDQRYLSVAFIFLDNLFGELYVMNKIDEITFNPMPRAQSELITLEELKKQLEPKLK
tara:strand:+ start:97 stop:717 length:621 start_codon:yes stop_codon:yes gene_type:complete